MSLLAAIGSYQIQVLGAPEPYWIMTFNAPQENAIRGIYVDSDGTLYGTGYEGSTGNRDIFLLSVSTDAQVNWQKRIDTGSDADFGSGVTADSTSIYIGATIDSTPTLTNDFYVSKHNKSDGAIVWQRALGSSNTQSVRDIAIDSTGAVYPTGFENVSSNMFMTSKLTSSGTQVWTRRRSTSTSTSQTYGVAIDGSDRVNVVGVSNNDEPSILQWSSGGTHLWSTRYSSFGSGYFNKVAVDSSNNIYAVGHMAVTGRANDMVIVSTNSSGTFRWARTLGSTVEDRGMSVHVTGSRIFVTGYTLQTPSSVQGAFIAEFDSLGNIVWQRTLSTSNAFTPNAIMHRGNAVWVAGQMTVDGVFQSLIAKLPDDGSSTGTHGVFQYANGVLTTSTVSQGTVNTVNTAQSSTNAVDRAGTGSLVETTISASSLEVLPPPPPPDGDVVAIGNESTGTVTALTELTAGTVISAQNAEFSTALSEPSLRVANGYIDIEQDNYSASSQPWTAQFWHYPEVAGSTRVMLLHSRIPGTGDAYANLRIQVPTLNTGFRYSCLISQNNTSWWSTNTTDNTERPLNNWYHVAVVWTGSRHLFFVNGVFRWQTSSQANNVRTGRHLIGAGAALSGYEVSSRHTGHIKDFQYIDGVELYTSGVDFTPPARSS